MVKPTAAHTPNGRADRRQRAAGLSPRNNGARNRLYTPNGLAQNIPEAVIVKQLTARFRDDIVRQPRIRPVGGFAKETLIYSLSSLPRRREPSRIKELDSRLRGNDE
jgi:hypothetical protein